MSEIARYKQTIRMKQFNVQTRYVLFILLQRMPLVKWTLRLMYKELCTSRRVSNGIRKFFIANCCKLN